MRTLLAIIFLLTGALDSYTQQFTPNETALLQSIDAVINDTAAVNQLVRDYEKANAAISESNVLLSFQVNQKKLVQARKTGDKKSEVRALSAIGYCYRLMGNTVKGLELALQSVSDAEQIGDSLIMAHCRLLLGHNYKDQGNHRKALSNYFWSERVLEGQNQTLEHGVALLNIGQVYLNMNEPDSALNYSQGAYAIVNRLNSEFTL